MNPGIESHVSCVCVCSYVCAGAHGYINAYEDQSLTLAIFLNHFSPYFLRQGLPVNPELIQVSMANQ